MTGPSSAPRGEHTPALGVTWNTRPVSSGEVVIPDGPWGGPAQLTIWGEDGPTPVPKPNRATRRAMERAARRNK